jgi:hypothetical protein
MFSASTSLARAAVWYSIRHRVFSRSGTSRRDSTRSIAGRGTARVAFWGARGAVRGSAGRTGAGSRLAAHQDSQAATAPRLRFQVAGARRPRSCSSRPASSSPLTSASGRLAPSPASSRSSTPF